jgi:hypothetical protein
MDAATRAARTSLLKMKILGSKVAQIIDTQLSGNVAIRKDLDDVFRIAPRTESGILGRIRALIPVWERANTALAALVRPGMRSPSRSIEGVDADFGHTTPLDPSGNMFGPFKVGQMVKVRTKGTNSTGRGRVR